MRFESLRLTIGSRRAVLAGLAGGGLTTLLDVAIADDDVAVARETCKATQ